MDEQVENNLIQQFAGPVLFNYVWWILREAQAKGIDTLYFLSRDGYLLREIAVSFCERFHLGIACKYLYCSRASLRMPTYHLIGDEAYELLLAGGYQVTLRSLLQRVELEHGQRLQIYKECGIKIADENRLLSPKELRDVQKLLRGSKAYCSFVEFKSKAAYQTTIGYLRQQGLLSRKTIAVVDSGWMGSMQRSLRQLLDAAGFSGELIGFYFGIYAAPKEPKDGTFLAWYFNPKAKNVRKALFCNNLFECMLSAPHGMTVGYQDINGIYEPIMIGEPDNKESRQIIDYINNICRYTKKRLLNLKFENFQESDLIRDTKKRVFRYMAWPKQNEVDYYGHIFFCDDITEAYKLSLANSTQLEALKGNLIPVRIWHRMLSKRTPHVPELYWPYGTMAFLPKWKRVWYWLNVFVWELIRHWLQ